MIQINTNLKHINNFISEDQLLIYKNKIKETFTTIYEKRGAGNDFLGWTTLPSEMTKDFIQDIKTQAELLRKKSEVFVVVGIGGSYLGARAVIEALSHQFGALINKVGSTQIVYAGHNMSEEYIVVKFSFILFL